jgi:hypothetical protein
MIMKFQLTIILSAICAAVAVVLLANSLVMVRADDTLVVFTAEDPVVASSENSFSGWKLRKPFSDYALVTQKVLQAKYDRLNVTSNDGRSCDVQGLAITYRFANPAVAANAERSQRKHHKISVSKTFEHQYSVGLVEELENWPAEQIQSTLRAGQLPDSAALTRAAAGYGASVLTVTDAPEVVCASTASLQPLQQAEPTKFSEAASPITSLQELAVQRDDYRKIVSGERFARQLIEETLHANNFAVDGSRTGCSPSSKASCAASQKQLRTAHDLLSSLRAGDYRLVAPVAYTRWFPINAGKEAVCESVNAVLSQTTPGGVFDDATPMFAPGQPGSKEGIYYFWAHSDGASDVAVVTKANLLTDDPHAQLRYIVIDRASCQQPFRGLIYSWRKASAGEPPLIAGDFVSRSTDFGKIDAPVEDVRSWGVPFGKIAVVNVGGQDYLLSLQALSGGPLAQFALGCDEQIELVLNKLDGAPEERATRFTFTASPSSDLSVDQASCAAAIKRLANVVGGGSDD